ncbi:MAG: GNAT family N-acetyltransferase [Pseudomonadota bacterium]
MKAITVRRMEAADIPACVGIINPIIAAGGSTAYEDPYSAEDLEARYLHEADISNVAISDGRVVGFQAVFEVEPGVFSVGSFTDQLSPVKGAGAALMAQLKSDCRAAGGTSIIAKITSDNTGGLSYYSKMGFEDETVLPAEFTRKDGTVVDRVIKRFVL